MNILEFCETFKISLAKAKRMDKAGVLRLDENMSDEETAIRAALAKGQPLTAFQLCALVERPGLLLDLGRYAGRAETLLSELGDAKGGTASREVSAAILHAARGDDKAVGILVRWMQRNIPARGSVSHSYLATRLLLGVPENLRKFEAPRLPRAIFHCRKNPELTGWYTVHQHGKRTFTTYHRPKGFDL